MSIEDNTYWNILCAYRQQARKNLWAWNTHCRGRLLPTFFRLFFPQTCSFARAQIQRYGTARRYINVEIKASLRLEKHQGLKHNTDAPGYHLKCNKSIKTMNEVLRIYIKHISNPEWLFWGKEMRMQNTCS